MNGLNRVMSEMGDKRTFSEVCAMSALPPKADIEGRELNVRFVPILLQKSFCIGDQKFCGL